MVRGHQRHTWRGRLAALGGTTLILFASMGATASLVTAADTANKTPSTQVGSNGWSSVAPSAPANVFGPMPAADDDAYVSKLNDTTADEGYGGFGVGVPAGSIVDGITVRAGALSTDGSGCTLGVRLSGDDGSSWTSRQTKALGASESTLTFGGASDTWGKTWDPTMLTNSKFRLEIRNSTGNGCSSSSTTSVDWIDLVVSFRTMHQGSANDQLSGTVCKSGDFNFVIDMSGSIGAQGNLPSNLGQLKDGINGFVNAFQNAGGDGLYAGVKFNGSSASVITPSAGYKSAAVFQTAVDGLSNPNGLTPTGLGIDKGAANDNGDRAGVPNVMFVLTDGSPNKPNTHSDDLNNPETWLQGANAAVDAADAARAGGDHYVVEAVYLSTPQDPGDTSLPFSNAGDSQWATQVMDQIGGGDHFDSDFDDFVNDLFDAIDCPPPPPAKIHIDKTADPSGPVDVGDPIGFDISISNTGQGDATDVTVHDNLPAGGGLDWSLSPAFAGCDISGPVGNQDLDCAFNKLASGASKGPIHVVSDTAPADCGTIDNSATIRAANDDPDSDDASVTVVCPNIKVTKTPDGGTLDAGDTITWTITVENVGKSMARDVVVTDELPTGPAWTESEADCSIDSNVMTCDVGDLAVDAARTYTVSAVSTSRDCGEIDNTASATATNEPKDKLGNNSDDGSVTIACAAIDIEKTADDQVVDAGDAIGFTVTVANAGPGAAKGVHVSDVLPTDAGLSWSLDDDAGGLCSLAAGNVTCDKDSLAAGSSFSFHISSPTTSATAASSPVDNSASVTTTNDGSDEDADKVDVLGADIQITKTADDSVVDAGDAIGFTITVTNNGAGPARGVHVADPLPTDPGTSWTAGPVTGPDSAGVTCGIAAGSLTCDLASLPSGGGFSIHISSPTTGATAGSSPVDNTATVTTTNDGSDEASDDVVVLGADIAIEKVADDRSVDIGDTIGFTVTVRNDGQGMATGVHVTDPLPTNGGLDWVLDDDAGGLCSLDAGVVTCDKASLASGGSFAFHISSPTTAATAAEGDVVNSASVTTTNDGSDEDDDTVSFNPVYGLTIDKSNDAPIRTDLPTAEEGSTVTYQLAYDLAADAVSNAVISDVLPDGIEYVAGSANSDGQFTFAGYDSTTRTLTWTAASVAEDGMVSYQAVVQSGAAELVQPLTNVAAIDSDQTEPDSDTSDVYVPALPEAATDKPSHKPTAPPTDVLVASTGTSGPGSNMALVLGLLGLLLVGIGFVTPVPARVRRRNERR